MNPIQLLHYKPLLAFAFAVGCLNAHAAAPGGDAFEGHVHMKMTDGTAEQTIEYFVKGDRMRVESEDPRTEGGAMIMNMSERQIVVLMPEEKMYMTMPLPDIRSQPDEEEAEMPEPTGETRTILGHEARKYTFEENGTEYEIWATDELGTFAPLGMGEEGAPEAASPRARALAMQKFFPLLIIERRAGQEQSRVEVTEVERKSLPDDLFEPPADYQGMQMPFGAPR